MTTWYKTSKYGTDIKPVEVTRETPKKPAGRRLPMSAKEKALQLKRDQEEMYDIMKDIFEKCQDAGILREEYGNEWVTLSGFKFDDYEFYNDYVEIKGERYAGCGEYDHCHINVPYDALDNIDGFIQQKKDEIAEEARKKAEAEAAEEAETKRQQEEYEKQQYLELKEKYEGAKVGISGRFNE